MDRLNGSIVLSKIDLKTVYHHIRIREDNKWKTTFRIQYSHYEYLVVLFKLTNISTTFQAFINQALRGLVDDFCVIYFNDILIFSRTKAEHLCHFKHMIKCLQRTKLYVNSKKCKFLKTEVEYLDFVIDKEDIQMDLTCIKTMSK